MRTREMFSILPLFTILLWLILGAPLSATEHSSPVQEKYIFYTAVHEPSRAILRGRLEEAFRRIGLKMELVEAASAQRSLIMANEEGDGDANRVHNIKELAPNNTTNLIQIPEPILHDGFFVYTKDKDLRVEGWESLKGYRNGARYGVKYVEKNLPEQRFFAKTTTQLLQMLDTDRLDTFVDWGYITNKAINDLHLTKIKQLHPPLIVVPTYAYINKKHQALVPKLAEALAQMKKDGTFNRILEDIVNPPVEQQEFVFYTGLQSPYKEILERRLKEAFRRIGKDFKLVSPGSSQRALVLANEEGDGDAARLPDIKEISPDLTANLLQIPESTSISAFHVYSKKEIFPITGWDALRGYNTGFRKGIQFLNQNIPGKTTMLPSTERLFDMLDTGRIDTVIEHSIIADKIIKENHLSGIHKLMPPLKETQIYSYIHKKHATLIPKITDALIEMKKDGTFQKIEQDVLYNNALPHPQED